MLSVLTRLSALAALAFAFASGSSCGWVDVGSVTLRMDSCYVQCQEVTEECWDQRFTCDADGNLVVNFYRDAETDCGGAIIASEQVPAGQGESVEAYSCAGTSGTCTTFHYVDQVHNPDSEQCGFLQVDVELVAEACFSTDGGASYMMQNCDADYSVSYCSDKDCSVDCVQQTKNIYGLDGDHCMDVKCVNEQTGQVVGVPVFLKGTRKYSFYNQFKPTNWTPPVWVGLMLTVLVAVSLVLQCKLYRAAKGAAGTYYSVKQSSDSS